MTRPPVGTGSRVAVDKMEDDPTPPAGLGHLGIQMPAIFNDINITI
jgi:hypothetical protein